MEERPFRVVVLDEATQATEPSSLIPLTRGAQAVVLAGDQKQLPPTVLSQSALAAGLGETLFERLIGLGLEYTLLDTQYRMHPDIMTFPSQRLASYPVSFPDPDTASCCHSYLTPKSFTLIFVTPFQT